MLQLRALGVFSLATLSACGGYDAPSDPAKIALPEELVLAISNGEARDLIVELGDTSARTASGLKAEGMDDPRSALQLRRLDADKDRFFGALEARDLDDTTEYRHLPVVTVRIHSSEALARIFAAPGVVAVSEDRPNEAFLTQSLPLIGQPTAAAAGALGAGATVAVLDTGVDFSRAAFGSCSAAGAPGCKVVRAVDIAPEDNNRDANGHGTNVAGIVLGVAPSAQIAALDVFRADGYAYNSDLLAALDWCIQNQAALDIVALNMSLGGGGYTAACGSDPLASSVAAAKAAGIFPAIASGNAGYTNRISSPACVPAAVSVGAVYDSAMGSITWATCPDSVTAADRVTCFSNSASFLTLLAPGALITAAGTTMGGTSQATPHVAGAAAVLRARFPGETVDQTLARLTSTGVMVTDPRNGVTKPRIALGAAVANGTDTTDPLGTVQINAGAASTRTAAVTLTITASDNVGVSEMCISNGEVCTAWQPFATTASWTLSDGDGTKTVSVTFRDAALNESAPATDTIVLDATAPTGTVQINGGAEFTSGTAVTLTIAATDPSNVATMCVSASGTCTSFVAYATTRAFTLPSGAGTKTVNVWFRDGVGNTSAAPASDTIVLDNVRPTNGTLVATKGIGQIALAWSGVTETGSGLARYRLVWRTGTAAPTSCTAGTVAYEGTDTAFVHQGLTNGTAVAYRLCAYDAAGNASAGATVSATPVPELDAPSDGTVSINAGAELTTSAGVTLTIAANDASTITQMCISAASTCTSWTAYATTKTYSLASGNGVKTVNVWFRDQWGNTTTTPVSDTITLDNTRPTNGTVRATASTGSIALTWSGFTDATAGIARYRVVQRTGTSAPTNCTTGTLVYEGADLAATHEGTTAGTSYAYRVCAVDNAGNMGTGATATARAL